MKVHTRAQTQRPGESQDARSPGLPGAFDMPHPTRSSHAFKPTNRYQRGGWVR